MLPVWRGHCLSFGYPFLARFPFDSQLVTQLATFIPSPNWALGWLRICLRAYSRPNSKLVFCSADPRGICQAVPFWIWSGSTNLWFIAPKQIDLEYLASARSLPFHGLEKCSIIHLHFIYSFHSFTLKITQWPEKITEASKYHVLYLRINCICFF